MPLEEPARKRLAILVVDFFPMRITGLNYLVTYQYGYLCLTPNHLPASGNVELQTKNRSSPGNHLELVNFE